MSSSDLEGVKCIDLSNITRHDKKEDFKDYKTILYRNRGLLIKPLKLKTRKRRQQKFDYERKWKNLSTLYVNYRKNYKTDDGDIRGNKNLDKGY